MEADKHTEPMDAADDIMLSSAEDLNNDGSFMGDEAAGQNQDDELDAAVAEVMVSEEPEDAKIDPEESDSEDDDEQKEQTRHFGWQREEKKAAPVVVIPAEEKSDEDEARDEKKEIERKNEHKEAHAQIVTAESYRGINKMALAWMIILTIILGGVVGIMIYAFILDHSGNSSAEPDPDSSLQENMNAVAGALEVYLSEVNLDNYNTDLVLVNGGGTVSLTGTLKHSVYINATSAVTLVLNGVTIDSSDNAAVINLGKSDLTIRVDGMNSLLAEGGKYKAAIYSNAAMTIRGDGQVMIYSSGAGSQAIASKNGYQVNGAAIVALGQASIEKPIDASTQAYFAKDLARTYKTGTIVSAADEDEAQVVKFSAPGDFSCILVSNSKLEDGVQYSISIGGSGSN